MTYEEFIEEWRNDEDFITVHTSGSTGSPKDIKLNKGFVAASAERTNRFFSIGGDCRLHSCISPDFIGGKMMAVRAEIAGCRLSYEIPSNEPLKSLPKKERLDLVAVVPSQMAYILDNLAGLPEIGTIIIGGAPISPKMRERIEASGLNAFETYGMTETASHIALRKIKGKEEFFRTLPGIRVGSDNRDCLKIMFESGEEFVTNDIAEVINEREFRIRGRIDNVINTGGKKVNPEEIEEKISAFVRGQFIVTGVPDEKWGEKIVLMIEGRIGGIDRAELEAKCREVLPSWQVPKEIIFVEKLPVTANGKLKRKIDKSLKNIL